MRRLNGSHDDAPFAELQHVKVDLDKTPYFYIDTRSKNHAEFAIKLIDEENGRMYADSARQRPVGKIEFNVPKVIPALSGKKTLTLRIYYIGREYVPRKGKTPHRFLRAPAGSVLEIHDIGFNAQPKLPKGRKK